MVRPPVRLPLRQGDLDGLCGIYAIINAIDLLGLSLPAGWRRELFEDLLVSLTKLRRRPLATVIYGMDFQTLYALAQQAEHQISSHDQSVRFRRLSARRGMDAASLWDALGAEMAAKRPVIISCGRQQSHWTVVRRLTAHSLILQDSINLRRIRKVHVAVKAGNAPHLIKPKHILSVR